MVARARQVGQHASQEEWAQAVHAAAEQGEARQEGGIRERERAQVSGLTDGDVDEDWVEEPEPLRTAHDPASIALGLSSGDDASDQELLDEERPDERSSRRARQALEPGVAAARESMAQRKRKSRSVTPTPAASSISSHFTPLAQKTPTSYSDESVADSLPPTRESGLRRKYLRAAVLVGHRVAPAQAPVQLCSRSYEFPLIKKKGNS